MPFTRKAHEPQVLITSAQHDGAVLMGFDGPTYEDHTAVAVEETQDGRAWYRVSSTDGGSLELSGPEAYKLAEEILRDRARRVRPVRIPILTPITTKVRQLDPAAWDIRSAQNLNGAA